MALSEESKALRQSCAVFKKCIDPANIVNVLYSSLLLTPEERSKAIQKTLNDGEKLDEIFSAMERRVSADPKKFHDLVRVLEVEPAMASVAKEMQS